MVGIGVVGSREVEGLEAGVKAVFGQEGFWIEEMCNRDSRENPGGGAQKVKFGHLQGLPLCKIFIYPFFLPSSKSGNSSSFSAFWSTKILHFCWTLLK